MAQRDGRSTESSDVPGIPRDVTEAQQQLARNIARMAPGSIDIAADRMFDSTIDRWGDIWVNEVDKGYSDKPGIGDDGEKKIERLEKHLAVAEEELTGPATTSSPADLARNRDKPGKKYASYARPGLIARHPVAMTAVHLTLLLVMGIADMATFYTVVATVMGTLELTLLPILVGFTAGALFLADAAGRILAGQRRQEPTDRLPLLLLVLVAWLGLGVIAFKVRSSVSHGASGSPWGQARNAPQDDYNTDAALLFVALYAVSGVVALYSAYRMHNPRAWDYARIKRELMKATTNRKRWQSERNQLRAAAETLKDFVRQEMAVHIQSEVGAEHLSNSRNRAERGS